MIFPKSPIRNNDGRVEEWLVQIEVANLSNRILVYPPLQVGVIKSGALIVHSAVNVDLFAGEAINIGAGERATAGDFVSKRVVTVAGHHIDWLLLIM